MKKILVFKQLIIKALFLITTQNLYAVILNTDDEKQKISISKKQPEREIFIKKSQSSAILAFEENSSFFFKCFGISLIRSTASLAVDHPFDVVATKMQSQSHKEKQRPFTTLANILSQNGIRGLYAGGCPKFAMLLARNAYQWPLMATFPLLYNRKGEESSNVSSIIQTSVLSGVSMATADLALAPFDRMKTLKITIKNKGISTFDYFGRDYRTYLKELMRGSSALYLGTTLSWIPFFALNNYNQHALVKKDSCNSCLLLSSSVIVGVMDVLLFTPFQMVKTQFQKENPTHRKGVYAEMKHIFLTRGIRGVYTGWQPMLVRAIGYTLFDFYFLSYLRFHRDVTN